MSKQFVSGNGKWRGVALLCGLFLAAPTNATCNSQWCTGEVAQLYAFETTTIVKMNMDMTPLNCTLASGGATLGNNQTNKENMYSMLLAALMSGTDKVVLRITENSSDCKIVYVSIFR